MDEQLDPRLSTIDRNLLTASLSAEAEIASSPSPPSPPPSPSTTAVPTRPPTTRTLTIPLQETELSRIRTYRLQHRSTVGSAFGQVPREQWLPLGGGKPFPPKLPDQEEFVVEFVGVGDGLHPFNWGFGKK